jgi:uncharacterized protein
MKTIQIVTLLCAANLLLPCVHAQQSEMDRQALAQICAKAEAGDVQSQLELGAAFSSGKFGLATNIMEAMKWWRQAAEQNHALAQHNLGVCYRDGQGVATDYVEAVKWFRKAAEQHWAEAEYNLAICFQEGRGLTKDPAEAVKWYRKAAEQHYAAAQNNLGNCYANGSGVAKDQAEAVKWVRAAAEQNWADAQYNLGFSYHSGRGVAKDEVEAVKWFRKAAEQNHPLAQNDLGACYASGWGVKKDQVEAVKWIRKAAEQDCVEGQYNLGNACAQGEGVAKDEAEAAKWYRKAAEQNHPVAQNNLGGLYLAGLGVTKDPVEAYKWALLAAAQGLQPAKLSVAVVERQLTQQQRTEGQRRASEFKPSTVSSRPTKVELAAGSRPSARIGTPLQAVAVAFNPEVAAGDPPADLLATATAGDAKAQNELGEAFYAGRLGVSRNPVEAVKWFRRAAEQDLAEAQSKLGVCYERGDGVAKYEVEAYKWDLLAAAQGETKAKRNAALLELLLSPDEIAEGKRRVQAWLEQRKKAPANNQ